MISWVLKLSRIAGGLIHKEHSGVVDQRPGNGHSAAPPDSCLR